MMMLSEIATAVKGRMQGDDVLIGHVGTDSRHIAPEQLFVAIKGERFDGNQFAADALQQGANAVVVSDANLNVEPAVYVDDSTLALGALAAHWRQKMQAPVVAITGSNGKTTTKEMLKAMLKASVKADDLVHATAGNLNNDIGMPLTLLQATATHQYIVLEMGMNHLGEIAYLTNIAKPKVAVVNNAGTAHIGELGSRENIAKAKGEIFEGLGEDGIAVLNADDAFADYWKDLNKERQTITFGFDQAADIHAEYEEDGQGFVLHVDALGDCFQVKLNASGQHNAYNALAAIGVATALKIDTKAISQGLQSFQGVDGRLQAIEGVNGALVIDDTYNANPDSMHAAIDVLSQKAGNTIFVMGDMAELGSDAVAMHAEIGAYASQKEIDVLLTLGVLSVDAAKQFGGEGRAFAEVDDLVAALTPLLAPGTTVLVKGSRSMRMERVVKQIQAESKREETSCS